MNDKVNSQSLQQEVIFVPFLPLTEVERIEQCKGYLIGTTNQLFLNFTKIKADIVVDLDKNTWFTPEQKAKSPITEQVIR